MGKKSRRLGCGQDAEEREQARAGGGLKRTCKLGYARTASYISPHMAFQVQEDGPCMHAAGSIVCRTTQPVQYGTVLQYITHLPCAARWSPLTASLVPAAVVCPPARPHLHVPAAAMPHLDLASLAAAGPCGAPNCSEPVCVCVCARVHACVL